MEGPDFVRFGKATDELAIPCDFFFWPVVALEELRQTSAVDRLSLYRHVRKGIDDALVEQLRNGTAAHRFVHCGGSEQVPRLVGIVFIGESREKPCRTGFLTVFDENTADSPRCKHSLFRIVAALFQLRRLKHFERIVECFSLGFVGDRELLCS